ncbi:glycosyltransferase family 39 protein [Patescibacteria group bacterium]|nr:glycosyltransferase family 39 protein [Patescibacteria group bacterium]
MTTKRLDMLLKKHANIALFSVLLIFIAIATYNLDNIPADWFGDISIVNSYVISVLSGQFPFYFSTSGGPFYMYLISPFVSLFGISYLTYKYLSVACGVMGLVAIYLFSKQVAPMRIAILTTLLTALSFWYLVWARLGNYNIISPLITALMMYFFIKYLEKHKLKWLALGIFCSCLGLFTYVGVFLLPIVLLVLVCWDMVIRNKRFDPKRVGLILLLYFPGFILFALLVLHDPAGFTNGYIGSKIVNNETLSAQKAIPRLLTNAFRTLLMLHVEGDIVFRWNVSKAPLLDWLSGIFVIIGFIICVLKEKKYLPYLLLPLILLPIPSILPGNPPVEIPSSSRTMAIIPFIFLFVAYGLDYSARFIKTRFGIKWSIFLVVISITIIGYLNLYNYFVRYPTQLPNENVSFGKEIARYIDQQHTDIPVYLPSLGWGEWGQPSYNSIYYSLKYKKRNIINGLPECSHANTSAFVIIFDPADIKQINYMKTCFPTATEQLHTKIGQRIFISMYKI